MDPVLPPLPLHEPTSLLQTSPTMAALHPNPPSLSLLTQASVSASSDAWPDTPRPTAAYAPSPPTPPPTPLFGGFGLDLFATSPSPPSSPPRTALPLSPAPHAHTSTIAPLPPVPMRPAPRTLPLPLPLPPAPIDPAAGLFPALSDEKIDVTRRDTKHRVFNACPSCTAPMHIRANACKVCATPKPDPALRKRRRSVKGRKRSPNFATLCA